MFNEVNCYFSSTMGYVIDGHHFGHDTDRASRYLIEENFMEPQEAEGYLSRMRRAFATRMAHAGVLA